MDEKFKTVKAKEGEPVVTITADHEIVLGKIVYDSIVEYIRTQLAKHREVLKAAEEALEEQRCTCDVVPPGDMCQRCYALELLNELGE